ncbi:hypothetical protein NDU88_003398 [Pleurodeles waltl]|uniref:Uncharacterized protein n=1 Tax=Pleurodeles waltl TaxID=8319 RepID=A0AAV7SFY5_PLEWA|nr:hypothetical protein NDU88_003398 [Pleurodeles waltl]
MPAKVPWSSTKEGHVPQSKESARRTEEVQLPLGIRQTESSKISEDEVLMGVDGQEPLITRIAVIDDSWKRKVSFKFYSKVLAHNRQLTGWLGSQGELAVHRNPRLPLRLPA